MRKVALKDLSVNYQGVSLPIVRFDEKNKEYFIGNPYFGYTNIKLDYLKNNILIQKIK